MRFFWGCLSKIQTLLGQSFSIFILTLGILCHNKTSHYRKSKLITLIRKSRKTTSRVKAFLIIPKFAIILYYIAGTTKTHQKAVQMIFLILNFRLFVIAQIHVT